MREGRASRNQERTIGPGELKLKSYVSRKLTTKSSNTPNSGDREGGRGGGKNLFPAKVTININSARCQKNKNNNRKKPIEKRNPQFV